MAMRSASLLPPPPPAMKNPPAFRSLLALASLLALGTSQGVTTFTYLNENGPGPFTPSYGNTVATNALSGLVATSSVGTFTLENTNGVSVLTDGIVGPVPVPEVSPYPNSHRLFASTGPSAGTQVTYALAAPTALSLIGVYGGWSDGGRDNQSFTISYSTDNGGNFIPLTPATNLVATNPPGTNVSATRTFVTDDTGPLAGGALITNLRFTFNTVENNWTGTSELIAVPVPEPGAAALSLIGAAGLLGRRRRR